MAGIPRDTIQTEFENFEDLIVIGFFVFADPMEKIHFRLKGGQIFGPEIGGGCHVKFRFWSTLKNLF